MAFIYVITNDINGKQYIGKTNFSIERRFQEHIYDSMRKRCNNRPLYAAMNKYGIEHFSISILEECSAEESADREIYWIDKLCTYGHTGYNATKGGDSKKYYDYEKIAKKYLELKNQRATAAYFGCDAGTVKIACESMNVPTNLGTIINAKKTSKSVMQCDKKDHSIIYNTFSSLSQAAIFMVENSLTNCKKSTIKTHIQEVCVGKRKSAAGFYWCFG